MEETLLYMIRHGKLVNSQKNCFTGQSNVPLSEEGWKETTSYLELLSKKSISIVLSSDLDRTKAPAEFYSNALNCPLFTLRELREIHAGRWENKAFYEVQSEENEYLTARFQDPINIPFPEGESLKELKERVISAFQPILEKEFGKNILLIGHAGVIRVLILHYLRIPFENFFSLEVDFASLSVLRFFKDGNVTLKLFNYRANLC